MKITLLADDAIRLETAPGPLTIEATSADMAYSPFHMLGSALATCTFSMLSSWASQKKYPVDDLSIDVQWRFSDDPHRVSDFGVIFNWPSLPSERIGTAKRVAELCAVHATLRHSPSTDFLAGSELPDHHHDAPTAASATESAGAT